MDIIHKSGPESGFFLAEEDGKRMGSISYEWAGKSVLAILHTVVDEAFQGRGVAKALLNAAAAHARENGLLICPVCSYVVKQFEKPEYDDVNYYKHQ